ncbi:MAG: hypothetical protein N2170_08975 [Bacteroidia bacterium]|nr:hypothetical protein [Bacteroidia bacterium]
MRVVLFDFLNAFPYQRALDEAQIPYTLLPNPQAVVQAWRESRWDAALLPMAVLSRGAFPVLSWGIGSCGSVLSVLLLGEAPPSRWEYLLLDPRSTSSRALVIWCMQKGALPAWPVLAAKPSNDLVGGRLVIGDDALRLSKTTSYAIDMGNIASRLGRKPVIFAVWWVRPPFRNLLARTWKTLRKKERWIPEAARRYGFSEEEVSAYWHALTYRLPPIALAYWRRIYRIHSLDS